MRPMVKQQFFSLVNGLIAKGITPVVKHQLSCDVLLTWEVEGNKFVERLSSSAQSTTASNLAARFRGWLKDALSDGEMPSNKVVVAEKGTKGEKAKLIETISLPSARSKTYRIVTTDDVEYLWNEDFSFAYRYAKPKQGRVMFRREVRGRDIISRLKKLVQAWDIDQEHSKIISLATANGLKAESEGGAVIVQMPVKEPRTNAEIFTPTAVSTVSAALALLLELAQEVTQ